MYISNCRVNYKRCCISQLIWDTVIRRLKEGHFVKYILCALFLCFTFKQIIWPFYAYRKCCVEGSAWIIVIEHLLCRFCHELIITSVLSQFYSEIQSSFSDLDDIFVWEICSNGWWRYFFIPCFLKHTGCSALQGIGMPSRQEFFPRDDWIMNETSLAAVFGWVILSNGASSLSEGLLMHHLKSVIWWMGWGGLALEWDFCELWIWGIFKYSSKHREQL